MGNAEIQGNIWGSMPNEWAMIHSADPQQTKRPVGCPRSYGARFRLTRS